MHGANETPQLPQAEVTDLPTKRQQFEKERMTRRQALRKIGIMSGVAAVALLSTDDLARMAASQLQQQDATKAIGDQLAKDFHGAGVAFADPANLPTGYDPGPCDCQCQCDAVLSNYNVCGAAPNGCDPAGGTPSIFCIPYYACCIGAAIKRRICYLQCGV